MAILKIIANNNCKLYIDQEFVCELAANSLHKEEISVGVYLVDVVSQLETTSFDLIVENDGQQFLHRIEFSNSISTTPNSNNELKNRSDIFFYNGLALVNESGLYGYINSNFEWVVQPEFSKAEHFIKKTAIVEKKFKGLTKISIIDTKGNNIIGGWFDQILHMDQTKIVLRRDNEIIIYNSNSFTIEELYDVCGQIIDNEPIPVTTKPYYSGLTLKAGYINRKGEVLLPFIYENVSNFSESGYAEVQRYGIKRYINKDGRICILNTIKDIEKKDKKFLLLDERFEWCGKLETSAPNSLFLSGCYRIAVLKDGKWGYYYLKEDSRHVNHLYEMIPCEYDSPFSDSKYGYVVMRKGRSMCVVNLVGAKYNRGEKKGQFVYGDVGEVLFSIECEELYAFNTVSSEWMDYGGYGGFEKKYDLSNFVVKKNGKYGIVDIKGNFLTRFEYDDIYVENENADKSHDFTSQICIADKSGKKEILNSNGEILSSLSAKHIFKIGNFWAVKPGFTDKYYLFDSKNKSLLQTPFDKIIYGNYEEETRYDGWSASGHDDYIIINNNYYGALGKDGKIVVECSYSSISHIGHKMDQNGWTTDGFEVVKNNKHGVFSAEGQEVLPCLFDEIKEIPYPAGNGIIGYFPIINKKFGYYTVEGEMILDCIYDDIVPETLSNEEFIIYKDGKCALLNCDKELVTDFIYDEIYDGYTDYKNCVTEKHECKFRRTYKVRQGNNIGIINHLGQLLVDCKYPFLRRCSTMTFDMKYRFEVGSDNCHGIIIEGGTIEVDMLYDSISDLGFYCNSFEVYVIEKNGKKALMSRWDKKLLTDYIYEEIKIHSNKDNVLTGFSVKTNGLWGFLDKHYNPVVKCQYNSISPIGDRFNNGEILAFSVTDSSNKKGVLNESGDVIVPLKYDNVFNEYTTHHQFVCYSNKLDKDKWDWDSEYEPFIAFDLREKKIYNLKTTNYMSISHELKGIVGDE